MFLHCCFSKTRLGTPFLFAFQKNPVRRCWGAKRAMARLLCLHLAGIFWGSLLLCALPNAQTMQSNRARNVYKVI